MREIENRELVFATRAEELGTAIWDFFIPPSFYERLFVHKATALVGGRGTGKTMVLKSMALEYQQDSLANWSHQEHVGCYVRVDTNVVASFEGKGLSQDEWIGLFGHYVNLRLTNQLLRTLSMIADRKLAAVDWTEFLQTFDELFSCGRSTSVVDALNAVRSGLNVLLRYINNPRDTQRPMVTNLGTPVAELCGLVSQMQGLEDKVWYFLIDEYENFSEYQQRVFNTLIKANQRPVIYKIAMRPRGWWTKETLRSTESLAEPADYDALSFEDDLSDAEYETLIKKVLSKRLISLGSSPDSIDDPASLFQWVSMEDEARQIVFQSNRKPLLFDRMRKLISDRVRNPSEAQILADTLILEDDPLRTRLHEVLIERGHPPTKIAEELRADSSTYREWYHHNRVGTLFLLCREYKRRKIYAGFDTFLILSSKIVRSFLWLFNRTWDYHMEKHHAGDTFAPETQSKAAYDVAYSAIREVESLARYGPDLFSFANYLGRLFEELHKDPRQSQPERNHFAIIGSPSEEAKIRLRYAVLYSVLQDVEGTKLRDESYVRDRDYTLNRVFFPFYQISHRKMHKLELKATDFSSLMSGDDGKRREVVRRILKHDLPLSDFSTQVNIWSILERGRPD